MNFAKTIPRLVGASRRYLSKLPTSFNEKHAKEALTAFINQDKVGDEKIFQNMLQATGLALKDTIQPGTKESTNYLNAVSSFHQSFLTFKTETWENSQLIKEIEQTHPRFVTKKVLNVRKCLIDFIEQDEKGDEKVFRDVLQATGLTLKPHIESDANENADYLNSVTTFHRQFSSYRTRIWETNQLTRDIEQKLQFYVQDPVKEPVIKPCQTNESIFWGPWVVFCIGIWINCLILWCFSS